MQKSRFLYTQLTSYKKAVTKTGAPKSGVTAFIVTEGNSYAESLKIAQHECGFNEVQLLGARLIS